EAGSLLRPVPGSALARSSENRATGAAAKAAPPAPAAEAMKPAEQDEELALYAVRLASADRARAAGDRAAAERALASCLPALRGWEWHYLRRAIDSPPGDPSLRLHRGAVTGLAFSPRG